MFKKLALILASVCIMFSFAACGNKDNGNGTSEPYQSQQQNGSSNSTNSNNAKSGNNDGIIDDTIDGIEKDVRDGMSDIESMR